MISNLCLSLTYQLPQRDDSGAITRKTETINGVTVTYDYTYDDMGRLIEACRVGGTHQMCETYAYDNNGNRLSATVNGVSTTASYTLDDQLEVYGDNSYRYDDDGYLVEKITPDGMTTYEYGRMGELREIVTPTQTITYQHNALNQRTAKLINGQIVEKYLWSNLTTLLAIYDANDNLVQRFEYAAPQGHFLASSRHQRMPVSMTTVDNTKYYLHYDQVGSLRAVSDASGQVIKEINYDTFGNIVSDSDEEFYVPFGFAGGLYDQDTGLVRFGYRDYDPFTGKWTAKDPMGFAGGDSNLYGYVLGDPVNFVDPLGLYNDPRLNGRGVPRAMGGDGKGNGNGGFPNGPFGPVCGASGSWQATWLIPDITPEACQKHDNCYSDCSKTKQECDLELYLQNSIYGQAVWIGGQDAYDKAQEHCKCSL